jgi:hypothetical protein
MFTGQWDISIMILGNSISVSIPMILVWLILFLTGLSLILTQINVMMVLPDGEQIITNVFGALFRWIVAGARGL